jgi:ElaB/YqjD/DUF883 family membrane-anchored ribosome-binding protein
MDKIKSTSNAGDAVEAGMVDLKTLQEDLNRLKDTVTTLITRTGADAAKSARDVTANIAGQVNGVASDLAEKGANVASAATDRAKNFAAEFEAMARRNPLGVLAGAVVLGVLVGMMGRRG